MLKKAVGVKELKNQLSSYLREVKAGTVILITDRGEVIAEIHQPSPVTKSFHTESIRQKWIEEETLRPPKMPKIKCPPSFVTSKPGTAIELLNQDRD